MISVEQFHLQDNSSLAYTAARLITSEVFGNRLSPEMYIKQAEDSTAYALLTKAGRFLGSAAVWHQQEPVYGTFVTELRTMAITPKEQGKGYGTALLKHVAIKAQEFRDDYIELLPKPESTGFYTKLGFEPSQYEDDFLTIDPSALIKRLAPPVA